MTSEKPLKLELVLKGELAKAAVRAAKEEGAETTIAWLEKQAEAFLKRVTRTGLDLSPKEVKLALNIKEWTYRDLVNEGAFPGMYHVNDRVVRIPLADVERVKEERRRAAEYSAMIKELSR